MIPEIGNFAIILALCFSVLQIFSPIYASAKNSTLYFNLGRIVTLNQMLFLMFAMLLLIACFIQNDLTVLYVREHSHHLLPLIYQMSAAWGGHEGSLLLWCLVLAFWSNAFIFFTPKNFSIFSQAKIISILGIISTGFISFLFFTSNPFKRDFPATFIEGNDLTPLLQDPGLIFHPPALYLGYVGFAIGFAFAICALIEGKIDKSWIKACRPWIILPWAYLGCGIVLGSWWAYRELGWGGWWFWDPVENASLLPWITSTALIHSLIVSEKRNVFHGWTILLAIITFGLSLIGTFLVRSGVLVSVHTFASDPTRGLFLLMFLSFIMCGSFILYGFRIQKFYQAPAFNIFSRETILLINSVVLLAAMLTIMLGTLYPIFLDVLQLEKLSVGEPYFNIVFTPMMLFLLLLMGAAPHVNWQQQSLAFLWKKLRFSFLISILAGILLPKVFGFPIYVLTSLGLALGIWIIISTGQSAYKLIKRDHIINLSHLSMIVAHLGVAIMVLGITINKSYSEERQVKIHPGESTHLAGYQFTFKKLENLNLINYQSLTATFAVQNNRKQLPLLLFPEQRVYFSHEQTLNKPGILFNAFRDLYLSLGTSFPDNSWSIRIYYKPCVRWIWFGGFMLLAGGLLALLTFKKNARK